MTAPSIEDRTPAVVIEDLTFLAEAGVGANEAARRVGYASVKSLDKFLRRHDQVALLNHLTSQDPLPLHNNGPTRHRRVVA